MDPEKMHETFSKPAVANLFDLLCHDISASETYVRMVAALRPPDRKVEERLERCIEDAEASYKEATEAQKEGVLRLSATAKIRGNAITVWREARQAWRQEGQTELSSAARELRSVRTREERRTKAERFAIMACYGRSPGRTERSWIGVTSSWMFLPHDAKHEGDRHVRWLDEKIGGGRGPRSLCMRTGPTGERSLFGTVSRTRSLGDDWCREIDAPGLTDEALGALEKLEAHYVGLRKETKGALEKGIREFREALPLMRSDVEGTTAQAVLGQPGEAWWGSRYVVVASSSFWETVPTCAVESLVSRAAWWTESNIDPFTDLKVQRTVPSGDPRQAEAHLMQAYSAVKRLHACKSELDDHIVALMIVDPYDLQVIRNPLPPVDELMDLIEREIGDATTFAEVVDPEHTKLTGLLVTIRNVLIEVQARAAPPPPQKISIPPPLFRSLQENNPLVLDLIGDPAYIQPLSRPDFKTDPLDARTRSWWMAIHLIGKLNPSVAVTGGLPMFLAMRLAIPTVWTCRHMTDLAVETYRFVKDRKSSLQALYIAKSIKEWRSRLQSNAEHEDCQFKKLLDESLRGLENISSAILWIVGDSTEWTRENFNLYKQEVINVEGAERAEAHMRFLEKRSNELVLRNILRYIVGTTMACPFTEAGVRNALEAANLPTEHKILRAYDMEEISQKTMVTPIVEIATRLRQAHEELRGEFESFRSSAEQVGGAYQRAIDTGSLVLPGEEEEWTRDNYESYIDTLDSLVRRTLARSRNAIEEMKDLPRLPPEGPKTLEEASERLAELQSDLRPQRHDASPSNVAIIRLSPS
jgi:hypothetical protein